jgi:DNA-binding NarL/FixJ family response regulator
MPLSAEQLRKKTEKHDKVLALAKRGLPNSQIAKATGYASRHVQVIVQNMRLEGLL